jgi:hypothetical protein
VEWRVQGQPVEVVARKHNISPATVYQIMARLKQHFRGEQS